MMQIKNSFYRPLFGVKLEKMFDEDWKEMDQTTLKISSVPIPVLRFCNLHVERKESNSLTTYMGTAENFIDGMMRSS